MEWLKKTETKRVVELRLTLTVGCFNTNKETMKALGNPQAVDVGFDKEDNLVVAAGTEFETKAHSSSTVIAFGNTAMQREIVKHGYKLKKYVPVMEGNYLVVKKEQCYES